MKTITIQIGNSDDKLTQAEWSFYVWSIRKAIDSCCEYVHFAGGSPGAAAWQNFCWVVDVEKRNQNDLRVKIEKARKQYRQDSVAWTEGETEFI